MSPWLRLYILVGILAVILLPLILKWRTLDGTFAYALWTFSRDRQLHGPSITEIAFSVVSIPLLVWFTFYSKNKRVAEGDKTTVALMLSGEALGLLIWAIRWLLHLG
jgi:uncharacterized membrane protein